MSAKKLKYVSNVIHNTRFRNFLSGVEDHKLFTNQEKLIFINCGDIHPKRDGPIFNCKEIFLDGNDKNFNFYWIDKYFFPSVQKIYLRGTMAESSCYKRFPKETWASVTMDYFPHDYPRISCEEFEKKMQNAWLDTLLNPSDIFTNDI
jgi:hypothetical protein